MGKMTLCRAELPAEILNIRSQLRTLTLSGQVSLFLSIVTATCMGRDTFCCQSSRLLVLLEQIFPKLLEPIPRFITLPHPALFAHSKGPPKPPSL